jgi:hypothetical protein
LGRQSLPKPLQTPPDVRSAAIEKTYAKPWNNIFLNRSIRGYNRASAARKSSGYRVESGGIAQERFKDHE